MEPLLYIIMRTDMKSMNPGKAMAQAAHAANAAETHYEAWAQEASAKPTPKTDEINRTWFQWKCQTTQGFGTTIVLESDDIITLKNDLEHLKNSGFLCGMIQDPTYPLNDGLVTHLISIDTCAYIFAPNRSDPSLRIVLDKYDLHA